MMTRTQRIDQSFRFVANGFELVARHPILLIYSFIFLIIPAIIVSSRYFEMPDTHTPEYAYSLITNANADSLIHLGLIVGFFILLMFVAASVTIHTSGLIRHKEVSVRRTLLAVMHHSSHLVLWGIVSTLVVYAGLALLHVAMVTFQETHWSAHVLWFLHFIVKNIWSFAVFFMIQIDSLENFGLIESFKRSCVLGVRHLLQIIAVKIAYHISIFFIGLGLIPLILVLKKFISLSDNMQNLFEGLLGSALLMLFFTVHIVFTTKLYNEHYKETL